MFKHSDVIDDRIRYTCRAADIYTSETLTVISKPLNIAVPTAAWSKLLKCVSVKHLTSNIKSLNFCDIPNLTSLSPCNSDSVLYIKSQFLTLQ